MFNKFQSAVAYMADTLNDGDMLTIIEMGTPGAHVFSEEERRVRIEQYRDDAPCPYDRSLLQAILDGTACKVRTFQVTVHHKDGTIEWIGDIIHGAVSRGQMPSFIACIVGW